MENENTNTTTQFLNYLKEQEKIKSEELKYLENPLVESAMKGQRIIVLRAEITLLQGNIAALKTIAGVK